MTDRDQECSWKVPRSGRGTAAHPAVTAWSGRDRFSNTAATATMSECAARRSMRYWLLGRLFLEEPAQRVLRELAHAMRADGLESSDGPAALAALEDAIRASVISPQELASLQAEFARLLRSPMLSRRQHERREFELTPPDHLGTELRLMSHLCHLEGEAWRAGDEPEARSLLAQEARVLEEHLLPWLPALCDQFSALAKHPFYRAMPVLVAVACRRDRETLAGLTHAETRVRAGTGLRDGR